MKMKGKIMLVMGIMLLLGLLAKGDFIAGFQNGDMISSITSAVIIAGLVIGGAVLMIMGRNE